jgi:hypothetical protein
LDEHGYRAEVADPAFASRSRLTSMAKIALPTQGNDWPMVLMMGALRLKVGHSDFGGGDAGGLILVR